MHAHVRGFMCSCQAPRLAQPSLRISHSAAHARFGHRRQVPHRLPPHHLHVAAATARAGPGASVAKPGQDGNSARFQTKASQINMQGFFETRISRAMTARSHMQPKETLLKYSANKTETCQVAERTAHRQSRSHQARSDHPPCRSCPPCFPSRPGSALMMPTTALEPCHP